jgi:hypothetical protein
MLNAQDRVAIEIPLLDPAVLEGDLQAHQRAQRVNDRALDLVLRTAHIDDRADIAGDRHLVHCQFAIGVDADFRNLGEMTLVAVVEGQSEPAARRHRPAPARFLRGQPRDGRRALGIEPAAAESAESAPSTGRLDAGEGLEQKIEVIAIRRNRALVQEALDRKSQRIRARRPPGP